MTEQDKAGQQPELTQKAVNPTLEVGGDIFMPEPGNGEGQSVMQPTPEISQDAEAMAVIVSGSGEKKHKKTLKERQTEARISWAKRNEDRILHGERLLPNERTTQQLLINEGISPISGGSGDEPVFQNPLTPQIKEFVAKAKLSGMRGIPRNLRRQLLLNDFTKEQIEYYKEHQQELLDTLEARMAREDEEARDTASQELSGQDKIIETADDYYSAVAKDIQEAPIENAIDAIELAGEDFINFSAQGLPKDIGEKYLNTLKKLRQQKELKPEEVREHFQDILRDIKRERIKAGIEDPFTESAPKVELTDEQTQELEKAQAEGEAPVKTHRDSQAIEDSVRRLERASGRTSAESGRATSGQPDSQQSFNDREEAIINELAGIVQSLQINPENILELKNNANVYGLIGEGGFGPNSLSIRQQYDNIIAGFDETNPQSVENTIINLSKFLSGLLGSITVSRRGEEAVRQYAPLNSAQELSNWIARKQSRELWGRGGFYELQDDEGNVNQANFLIWLRQQSNLLHSKFPNSPMEPLNSIGITTDWGNAVSIFGMSLQPEAYMKDERRKKVLYELADELIDEAYMFGEIRNGDLTWRQGMGDDKKIADVISAVHAKNAFTRPGNLQMLMNMSAEFVENKEERDTMVGDAFRMGTEIYYNISDRDQLIDIFQEHPLTIEDFKNAIRIRNEKFDWDEGADIGEYLGIYSKEKGFTVPHLFKENGEVDMGVFVTFLNIYSTPSEIVPKVELLRELVRIKTAQKYGGEAGENGKRSLGVGIALTPEEVKIRRQHYDDLVRQYGQEEGERKFFYERAAERVNVEFADNLSYGIQRVYGAASKHDLGRAGYDAFGKTNVQEYLAKQGDVGRGGSVGIPEQLGLFRDLSPDMISGLRTESGRTIYEILRDLREIDNGKEVGVRDKEGNIVRLRTKKDLIKELTFKENAEIYLARNQQMNGMQIFNTLKDAKALDLDKIVTWSISEGERMDVGEFQAQINEGIIRPFRYADINSLLNFAEQQRIYDPHATRRLQKEIDIENANRDEDNQLPPAVPQYRDGTLLEKTKGKEIVDKVKVDYEKETDTDGMRLNKKYKTFEEFLNSRDANIRAAKNSSLAVFGAQLRSHASLNTLGKRWGYTRTETFIRGLETIQDYDYDEKTGRYKPNGKKYFSKKDIAWLRKNSGTEVWRMLSKDAYFESAPALGGGIWESFVKFLEALAKDAIKPAA